MKKITDKQVPLKSDPYVSIKVRSSSLAAIRKNSDETGRTIVWLINRAIEDFLSKEAS